MKALGFRKRRLAKSITKADAANRDAQFEIIKARREAYEQAGLPIFSVDSKRKESLGRMFRAGESFANGPLDVLDHDLPAYSDGQVTPHGLFDVTAHQGHVNLTAGHDTGQFACHSLEWFWEQIAAADYPNADSMLLLCDGGGSNSTHSKQFKYYLNEVVQSQRLTIEVAHYPPYCSKYNPIERLLFPHVERSLAGRWFPTIDEVAAAIGETSTSTGLTTTAHVIEEQFEPASGKAVGRDISDLPITHDPTLPKYNYKITPV